MEKRICLITFSNNVDHQNVIYSMFDALSEKHNTFTIGIKNPKSLIAPKTSNNLYIDCPLRPGITKGTFNFKVLFETRKWIKKNEIDVIYFESQHIWNMFLMMICSNVKKVVAVHDVIPHDGNKFMALSNFVTCKLANHIVLRNSKYKELLSRKYRIQLKNITSFEPWRFYPEKKEIHNSGIFLYFGRIRKYKGFDLFAKIIEQTPNIHYRVVGESDDESRYLVDYVKSFANVELIDKEVSEKEMIDEFTNADWIVLPYSNATQSGVITDAYRFARPVISFDVGALSEQIDDGKSGFLIPEQNVDAFSKKILEVSKFDKKRLQDMSDYAYKFGYEKYSAKVRSEAFFEVLINS